MARKARWRPRSPSASSSSPRPARTIRPRGNDETPNLCRRRYCGVATPTRTRRARTEPDMSYEAEQETNEGQEGAEGAGDGTEGGADDLNEALQGGEMAFVTETKQPMNKGTLVVVGLLIAC